jgi:hypothetical protein
VRWDGKDGELKEKARQKIGQKQTNWPKIAVSFRKKVMAAVVAVAVIRQLFRGEGWRIEGKGVAKGWPKTNKLAKNCHQLQRKGNDGGGGDQAISLFKWGIGKLSQNQGKWHTQCLGKRRKK